MLSGLNQKVCGQVHGAELSPAADDAPPAQRHDLTRSGIDSEHGKPVVLPVRESEPQGKPMGLRVAGRGESERRPVIGRIGVATSSHAKAGRLPRGEDARERSANRRQAASQISRPGRNGRSWCGCHHRITSGAGSELVSCRSSARPMRATACCQSALFRA